MQNPPKSAPKDAHGNAPEKTPESAIELKTSSEWQRLLGFAMTGAGGFIVHAAMLSWLINFTSIDQLLAWFPAFITAVLFTWLVNRFIAFKGLKHAANKKAEAALYFLVQSLGAAINFIIYSALILYKLAGLSHPIIALAIGSIAAFGFNYIALRLCVYKDKPRA